MMTMMMMMMNIHNGENHNNFPFEIISHIAMLSLRPPSLCRPLSIIILRVLRCLTHTNAISMTCHSTVAHPANTSLVGLTADQRQNAPPPTPACHGISGVDFLRYNFGQCLLNNNINVFEFSKLVELYN